MMSSGQDGSDCNQNILASFLDSGRKWKHVVCLYMQSIPATICVDFDETLFDISVQRGLV